MHSGSLKPYDVNLWYFQLWQFDIAEFIFLTYQNIRKFKFLVPLIV